MSDRYDRIVGGDLGPGLVLLRSAEKDAIWMELCRSGRYE